MDAVNQFGQAYGAERRIWKRGAHRRECECDPKEMTLDSRIGPMRAASAVRDGSQWQMPHRRPSSYPEHAGQIRILEPQPSLSEPGNGSRFSTGTKAGRVWGERQLSIMATCCTQDTVQCGAQDFRVWYS